jgi:2-desacetyl-2-hydroxyethyl bacteriochlorophyllide A dehydrogenase
MSIQIILPALGQPETLTVQERATPRATPGSIVVELEASGVSYAEVQMLSGRYPGQPAFPFVPGYDLVGRIVELGAGASGFSVGDRVAAMTLVGAWAEHVVVDARAAVLVPRAVNALAAAAVIVNGVTARRLLIDARVRHGHTVLVHGAGGGVGTLLVQLARELGARVIGTGRPAQRAAIEALGAEFVDYTQAPLAQPLRDLAPQGFNAVFDHVGGANLRASYALLNSRGTLMSYGSASTRNAQGSPWAPIVRNMLWAWAMNLRLGKRRVRVFDVWGRSELGLSRDAFYQRYRADLSAVLARLAAGALEATIADTFELTQAAAALRRHQSGATAGKILLSAAPLRMQPVASADS